MGRAIAIPHHRMALAEKARDDNGHAPPGPTAALMAEIVYRELFIYDACGFEEEGKSERSELRRLVMTCSMSKPDKGEAMRFMDSPANQHYGDHDKTLCSVDPYVARMVKAGSAASETIRHGIIASAAQCASNTSGGVAPVPKTYSLPFASYWQSLSAVAMSGLGSRAGAN
jgi:hypothetical protein